MLPNQVSTASTPAAAADRPQLKLAARAGQDAGGSHSSSEVIAASDVIDAELRGWNGQWRRTLETVKATLADLEQACESAVEAREGEIAVLRDTLADAVAAEAALAAGQAREQAQVEIDRLQSAVTDLQTTVDALQAELATERSSVSDLRTAVETMRTDLDAERDKVSALESQLEVDGAARALIEAERDEARGECQRQAAAAESQVEALRAESRALRGELALVQQQLGAAVAERSKVTAAFQLIQRTLADGLAVNMAALAENVPLAAPVVPASQPIAPGTDATSAPAAAPASSSAAEAPALTEAQQEVVDDVKRVLEQVEAIYQLDFNAGRSGTELVDSLTSSLQYARDLIVARWNRDDCDAATLFEDQLAVLLDLHAGNSFARHLSIAAYESRNPTAPADSDAAT